MFLGVWSCSQLHELYVSHILQHYAEQAEQRIGVVANVEEVLFDVWRLESCLQGNTSGG